MSVYFLSGYMQGSSERTHQATVGAILVHLHASIAVYFC